MIFQTYSPVKLSYILPEYAPEVGPANRAPGDWGLRGFLQAPGLLQRP